ncbi:MAG TPA: quinone oxidoreductase [Stackebrandtia sp.]|jgi:NADPH2:quinone reductase|uniref:quinone oxidoreductase family protein n=1 Tax=Stackebrandtia sp. TaxID=2023065 RepID=UPI002D3FFE38|nr:quinone oxidoreductase [Stackebrandtia sp.]HZE41443.1 quinone oxidoreductase [Stackebrandtia sp.]
MKAIVVSDPGGPEALVPSQRPDPRPGPGQVVVDVAASGVNFIDVYHRTGRYPMPTPFTPGLEGAGTVAAVGSDVDSFGVGDRVAWAQVPGSYAARVVAPAAALAPVPDGVASADAAAVMLQGMTAHYLSTSTHGIQEGDVAVVHAAAGGVGLLLTQMIKRLGGKVLATVSTPAKAELARGAGADEVYDYADFPQGVKEFTGGAGAHVIYDGVGLSTFEAGLASLRPRGMMALFGQSSGAVPPMDPQVLSSGGSLFLTRPTLAHYIANPAEFAARAADIFGWIAAGQLSVHIGGTYPLDAAADAHRDLEGRRTTGKLLLTP